MADDVMLTSKKEIVNLNSANGQKVEFNSTMRRRPRDVVE